MTQHKVKYRVVKRDDKILLQQVSDDVAQLAETHVIEREIACKFCGSTDTQKYGSRKGIQEYLCNKCGRKFIDKDAPFKKQTPTELIGTSLSQYYDGLSFGDIARHLKESGNEVNESTVYRWIFSYTNKALNYFDTLQPQVSDNWLCDETVLKIAGRNVWFWDVIDEDTRFLLASHLSDTRGIHDVMTVMHRSQKKAGKNPHFILTDALGVYPDGIERIFGAESKHIQMKGITSEINTNIIERFHSTIKERTKVMRGFKSLDTAELIMDGFLVHYNYFRPHMSLDNSTPAEVAKIKIPFKTWTDFVRSDK
jgi:putative transposase